MVDRTENFIDLIDTSKGQKVHRLETAIQADHVLITPYAPVLLYLNVESQMAVFHSLETGEETGRTKLPFPPANVVMDTTGAKAGITNPVTGGFALLSLYAQKVELALDDFPATGDVLFDPNEVDVYYSVSSTGSLGILDMNTQELLGMKLADGEGQKLSSPSRSLDARYVYVANETTGEVYSLNAFSRVIYRTFDVGAAPARPYTTPQGAFLYMTDKKSGRFLSIDQGSYKEYADIGFEKGVDLVTVGRFDRFNLFLSTAHKDYYIFDNIEKTVVSKGTFKGQPIDARGAADGKTAYIAFSDIAELAMVNLEYQAVQYLSATNNGARAFTIGLSNNVCH